MQRSLKRLLIVNDQYEFVLRLACISERLGFATRILRHSLDLGHVMQFWRPDFVAIQMEMPDLQEVEVLNYLEEIAFLGSILLTGNVPPRKLEEAANVARLHGLSVAGTLVIHSNDGEIEAALRLLSGLERAA